MLDPYSEGIPWLCYAVGGTLLLENSEDVDFILIRSSEFLTPTLKVKIEVGSERSSRCN